MGLRSCSCLLLLLLGLLVPAVVVALGKCSTDPCPTAPDCTNCAEGEMVSDPSDCRRFYVCDSTENPSAFPLNCDAGEVFNSTIHACVPGGTCVRCPPRCEFACSTGAGSPTYVANRLACDFYTECNTATGDTIGNHVCPTSEPFFEGDDACQQDQTLCCKSDPTRCCHCQPYCPTGSEGTLVADPQDCRRSYYCTKADEVPTISSPCENGEYFDSAVGDCTADATCDTPSTCRNVVDFDGCIEPFTCTSLGYFAKCPYAEVCSKYYYHCTEITGDFQPQEECYTGTVFHPDTHICVAPEDCP